MTDGIGTISQAHTLIADELQGQTVNPLDNVISSFLDTEDDFDTSKPRAFINWVLFDEQFKFVSSGSGFEQVGTNEEFKTHTIEDIPVTKNGYLYVYVSNQSSNVNVYFDNLQVTHVRGPLLEETHYYPFGLTMHGISSKALAYGDPENKRNKFQNQELTDDFGINYYEFKYRNHDPQIGRFVQIDPLSDKYPHNSTYAFSENKVTNHFELEGLESMWSFFKTLTNSAGIRENNTFGSFTGGVAKEFKNPQTYAGAVDVLGQVTGAALIILMTDGTMTGSSTVEVSALDVSLASEGEVGGASLVENNVVGGRKGDIETMVGYDRHEIPSKNAMAEILGVASDDVPAIRLPLKDIHNQTATFGGSSAARAARQFEKNLIQNGQIGQAFDNGVNDVLKVLKTPQAQQALKAAGSNMTELNTAIQAMRDYFNKIFQ